MSTPTSIAIRNRVRTITILIFNKMAEYHYKKDLSPLLLEYDSFLGCVILPKDVEYLMIQRNRFHEYTLKHYILERN